MILVDSTSWIDYFRGTINRQTDVLHWLLDQEPLATGDLIITEVLQGFPRDADFNHAKRLLHTLTVVDLCGKHIAVKAAQNYRILRQRGFTIRKTIDTIIATKCIEGGFQLLHNDHDFDPFEEHLGLRVVV